MDVWFVMLSEESWCVGPSAGWYALCSDSVNGKESCDVLAGDGRCCAVSSSEVRCGVSTEGEYYCGALCESSAA